MNSIQTFAVALAAACAVSVPALAEKVLDGKEAHALLTGRQFEFVCVDGTRGQASYAKSGAASASYRLGTAPDDAAELTDRGRVRRNGSDLCIRWQNLNAGEEGCYRITKRGPDTYRIAEGVARWCDLTVKGSL